jgi:VIT1/CCC1 family predicted Fe2+/Mn2+ transporter
MLEAVTPPGVIEAILGDDVRRRGRYLPEVIYGANDGIVTTFAVVAGVAGAALDPGIVVVLGTANLLADGFSMGMSNFLSRRSEVAYRETVDGREGGSAGGTGGAGPDAADGKPARRTAAVTFAAFVVAGWTPLVPYLLGLATTFPVSVVVTGVAFFLVGASRSLVTDRSWVVNGAEMFAVGMLAAAVAFGVGTALEGLA